MVAFYFGGIGLQTLFPISGYSVSGIAFKKGMEYKVRSPELGTHFSYLQLMGVDVIGVAPYSEEGWDAVFAEAAEAGIPIIMVDRTANVADEALGPPSSAPTSLKRAKTPPIEMSNLLDSEGMIVELEGSPGASAANAQGRLPQ